MGWRVIALGMDREAADAPGVEFSKLDITDETAVKQAVQGLDGIDALVNAAGLIRHEGREWGAEGFRQVLEVNLVGTQIVTMACKDGLAQRHGAVVNFASMFSWFGSRNNPSYAASKGVVALTRSHAMGFAEFGIRVNAVAPGWTTPGWQAVLSATPIAPPASSRAFLPNAGAQRTRSPK